jgi:hypothetical protein
MTEDELLELAELRRRAYGPDADIARDPVAQARLAELEDASRRENPGPALALSSGQRTPSRVAEHRDDAHRPAADELASTSRPDPAPAQMSRRRTPGARRSVWIVAVLGVVAVVMVGAVALWPRLVPAPAAAPTPSTTPVATDVTCGNGWGARAAGRITPPHKSEVVWSPLWDSTSLRGPTIILFTGVGQWLGQLTPVFVPGGVASVVQVIGPASARIVTFADSRPGGDSITTSDYPDSDAMVAAGRRLVPLPPCPDPDTYPLLVIAPDDACVQLEITLAGGPVYRAVVAIGDEVCPRP